MNDLNTKKKCSFCSLELNYKTNPAIGEVKLIDDSRICVYCLKKILKHNPNAISFSNRKKPINYTYKEAKLIIKNINEIDKKDVVHQIKLDKEKYKNINNIKSQSNNPKTNDTQAVIKGCSFIFVLFMLGSFFLYNQCSSEESKEPMTQEEIIKNNFNSKFSGWDGSHVELEKKIKANLNDPNSLEIISCSYQELNALENKYYLKKWNIKNSFYKIKTIYTAKNAFGGRVKHNAIAILDEYGDILFIETLS